VRKLETVFLAANVIAWVVGFGAALWFYLSLRAEGEVHAPGRWLRLAGPTLFLWLLLILAVSPGQQGLLLVPPVGGAVFLVWVVYRGLRFQPARDGRGLSAGLGVREEEFDERDTLFARMAWAPGGAAYDDYYANNPDSREVDDALRELPDLCGEGTITYDVVNSRVAPSIFELLQQWHSLVELDWSTGSKGEPIPIEGEAQRRAMSKRLKGMARYYGALDAGVARLDEQVIYSHIGRREAEYGEVVHLAHDYGVVFTVEMNYRYIRSAPRLPVVIESSHQYMEAAKTALALAANIRAMGWEARAHMDGNYFGILPPLAVQAGLGEIGRMGLLVTEGQGPRVRLGLVTTDMPLAPDEPQPFGLQEFCKMCQKCAEACPPRAISTDEKPPEKGWNIDWEPCYKFWRISGTDCATCISSCPYSKPVSPLHQLVRLAVRDSDLARRFALWADDFVYGKRHFDEWEPAWFEYPNPRGRG
jgi:ferredoxin